MRARWTNLIEEEVLGERALKWANGDGTTHCVSLGAKLAVFCGLFDLLAAACQFVTQPVRCAICHHVEPPSSQLSFREFPHSAHIHVI